MKAQRMYIKIDAPSAAASVSTAEWISRYLYRMGRRDSSGGMNDMVLGIVTHVNTGYAALFYSTGFTHVLLRSNALPAYCNMFKGYSSEDMIQSMKNRITSNLGSPMDAEMMFPNDIKHYTEQEMIDDGWFEGLEGY